MRYWKAYIAYLKDNPEHYWFKRKAYGWGWTPATREGWFVIGVFILFVLGLAWRADRLMLGPDDLFPPLIVAVLVLLFVCYKTGEKPGWQWKLPEKYFEDDRR